MKSFSIDFVFIFVYKKSLKESIFRLKLVFDKLCHHLSENSWVLIGVKLVFIDFNWFENRFFSAFISSDIDFWKSVKIKHKFCSVFDHLRDWLYFGYNNCLLFGVYFWRHYRSLSTFKVTHKPIIRFEFYFKNNLLDFKWNKIFIFCIFIKILITVKENCFHVIQRIRKLCFS